MILIVLVWNGGQRRMREWVEEFLPRLLSIIGKGETRP